MSVEAMTWAFGLQGEGAPKLAARLVLLGLADNAGRRGDDEQMVAWPSVATLARKASLSERAVQYALRSLEHVGWVEGVGHSEHGTVIYALSMGVQNLHRGAESGQEGGANSAPEPSVRQPSKDSSLRSEPTAAGRERAKELKARPDVKGVCDRLASHMQAEDAQAKTFPGRLEWLEQAAKLIDDDHRHFEEIVAVMDWAYRERFWPPLIHTMRYFRIKYPTLRGQWLKAQRQPAPGSYVPNGRSAAAAQQSPRELVEAYEEGQRARDAELRRRLGLR